MRRLLLTGIAAKKLLLLSIVRCALFGRLAIVATLPRLFASAMIAPPCRMSGTVASSLRAVSSSTLRARVEHGGELDAKKLGEGGTSKRDKSVMLVSFATITEQFIS